MTIKVEIIPCFEDNYAYLLDAGDGECVAVDPGEAAPVLAKLGTRKLIAVWATHHHPDHVGGVPELVTKTKCAVVGHASEQARIPNLSVPVNDGDVVQSGALRARAIHVPGHTLGAIAFFVEPEGSNDGLVFTGDTLFISGCGRLFEGTAEQMFQSFDKLKHLRADTQVFPGHEYTVKNLEFALSVEPNHALIPGALREMRRRRSVGEPTIPGRIDIERAINPFMRVQNGAEFAERRAQKDRF